ncbi:hypothetical protein ABZT28_51410, partial [Streptomyces sp. NPDC005388]
MGTDARRYGLRPDLRSGEDGSPPHAAALRQRRAVLRRAFQRLPERGQLLLWHTEVEAEDIATSAALPGLEVGEARLELERARTRLRVESRQAHLDLAPDDYCRRYSRLIGVYARPRAVQPMPDIQQQHRGRSSCSSASDLLAATLVYRAVTDEGGAGSGAGERCSPRPPPGIRRPAARPRCHRTPPPPRAVARIPASVTRGPV